MTRTRTLVLSGLLCAAMSGCGQPASDSASGAEGAEADVAPATGVRPAAVSATSTRDDVIAALRCHAVLSSAMASRIVVGGDGSAVVGIREKTRWFTEANRRADAAGLSEDEFRTLMAETRAPMTTPEQQAENRPLMEECLANIPAL